MKLTPQEKRKQTIERKRKEIHIQNVLNEISTIVWEKDGDDDDINVRVLDIEKLAELLASIISPF
jgi:hypothetical protein